MTIDGENYLRTGDLGFIDKGGELYITGRIKDLIIINGSNYYPQDIEFTAESKNSFIRKNSVAAFSVDRDHKEQLVIVVEINKKMLADFDAQKLGSEINSAVYSNNALSAHEIIFITSGNLPKTTSGKIQRQTCKNMYLANELDIKDSWKNCSSEPASTKDLVAPPLMPVLPNKTEVIDCLISFISKTLKIPSENVISTTKFSDFNMDSIQIATVSVELEKIINVAIPEKIFYECSTLQDITDALMKLTSQLPPSKTTNDSTYLQTSIKPGRKIAIPKFSENPHKKIN
jgi:acyl carrier protein